MELAGFAEGEHLSRAVAYMRCVWLDKVGYKPHYHRGILSQLSLIFEKFPLIPQPKQPLIFPENIRIIYLKVDM